MSRHADAILATVEGASTSLVAASWRRCASHYDLDPDRTAPPERNTEALRASTERNGRLIGAVLPYLDQLLSLLDDVEAVTNLSDADGLMLACRSGTARDAWERQPDKWLGTLFDERHAGTNGLGTALAEERLVAIRGDEHFLSPLTSALCIAAPIHGPDTRIIGCLNAKMNRGAEAMSKLVEIAVGTFVRRIEHEMFAAAFPQAKLVLVDEVGRNPGAVIAVDRDDVVVGATRAARRLLNLSERQLAKGIDHATLRPQPMAEGLAEAERKLIVRALLRHDGNISAAAKAIGISRSTFYRKARAFERA